MDNDEFNGAFDEVTWRKRLLDCKSVAHNCCFILARDKVGDWKETVRRFYEYAPIIRECDYPVGFATQDGLVSDKTPWDEFDCLFVGGSNQHKLTREAGVLINEAINRGKWIHIGRVNSPDRMRKFWRADSWDGTHLSREPSDEWRLATAVREIRHLKETGGLF